MRISDWSSDVCSSDLRGGNRILHREVDSYPADRRHRMRGVADREQAGTRPAGEAVERDREQFDIVEAADGVDARGQPWNERRHIVAESRDPARLDRRETALFADLRALPIIPARDRDDHADRKSTRLNSSH